MDAGNLLKLTVDATLHVVYAIVKLIVLPINLWAKAVARLAEQKNKGLLDVNNIRGIWPFFSYIKRLLVEFLFDAISFLSYPVGIVSAIVALFIYIVIHGEQLWIAIIFTGWIILIVYVIPVAMALCRDTFQLLLLPINKIINWFRKPLQQIDIDIRKHDNQ